MAEVVVLDTWACFAFLENEAGADIEEAYLLDARAGRVAILVSFVSLTEVEYFTLQERGADDAAAALTKMKGWPIRWHNTDDNLCSAAAKLKAGYKISFADAFVAATALQMNGTLVHKDPEFDSLSSIIKLQPLPRKTA